MRKVGGLAAALLALSCSGKTLLVGSNDVPPAPEAGAPAPEARAPPREAGTPTFGDPEVIVRRLPQAPLQMVSDGVNLYWVDEGTDVWTVPVAGGTPATVADDATARSTKLVYVDDARVYYLSDAGFAAVRKQDGAPLGVVVPAMRVLAATVVAGVAYWVGESKPPGAQMCEMSSAPLATRPPAMPKPLATLPTGTWSAIAVTATDVVASNMVDLVAVPIHGGETARTLNGSLECVGLLGVGSGVYCAQSPMLGKPPLVLVATDGGTSDVAPVTTFAGSMAADLSNLYWVDKTQGGGVEAVPLHGGRPFAITHEVRPGVRCVTLAIDAHHLYWAESDGTIRRVSK